MRLSTGMIFDKGVGSIQQRTSSLLRTQQQIASGRRMLTPSDDPVAAARSMEVTQSQEINKQYQKVQDSAKGILGTMDGQLSSMSDVLTRIHELTVQAGDATLKASDRASIATELRVRFDELIALGNSTDGTGQYLFSGYQGSNKPFAGSVDNGVSYVGDAGQRTLSVSGSRDLPINSSGNDLFMQIKNGNGVFTTGLQSAKSVNLHSLAIDAGSVTDTSLWNAAGNPADVELRFWVDAAGGGVNTKGFAVGNDSFMTVAPGAPFAIDSLALPPNNQFNLSLDGGLTTTPVTVPDGNYPSPAALIGAVQSGIDAALGVVSPLAGSATVSLDAASHIVVTSNRVPVGTGSSVTLSAVAGGNTGFASLFGMPTQTSGLTSTAGQTFYDLVDKATGRSLFTGAASAAAASGSYTRPYMSGAAIPLSNAGPAGTLAFDLGAAATVTGVPVTGDTFTIGHRATGITTSPSAITRTAAVIDRGTVTSPIKWSQTANSGNLELRFWTDPTGGTATAGATTGALNLSTALTYPFTFTPGTNDQFQIAVDGNPAVTATIDPLNLGPYADAAAVAGAVQNAIDTSALGPGQASVSLDATNRLVVTSNTTGAGSGVAISDLAGNGGNAALFGGAQPTAGAAAMAGTATGAADLAGTLAYPYTFTLGSDDQFQIAVDGNPAVTATIDPLNLGPHADATALAVAVQAAIDNSALGPGQATVSLDASNHLVVTSNTPGAASSVAIGGVVGNSGSAALFGGPGTAAGTSTLTAGSATGLNDLSATLAYPYTFTLGVDDQFQIALDGNPAVTAAIDPLNLGPYADATALAGAVQAAIDNSPLGPGQATVILDGTSHLVVTSNTPGAGSDVTISDVVGNGGNAALFGGTNAVPGTSTPVSAGDATGAVDLSTATYPYTFTLGIDDQFQIAVDGNPAVTATIDPLNLGPYADATALAAAVQTAIDNSALGAGRATVALDGTNHLVVTSTALGAGSSIALGGVVGNAGAVALFGGAATVAGASATAGTETGAADLSAALTYPFTFTLGANDQFQIAVDGNPAVTATIDPLNLGPYADATALAAAVQTAIDNSPLGPGQATVTLDATNHLVVSSNTTGAASNVAISSVAGNAGNATLFGGAAALAGGSTGGVQTPGYAVAAASAIYPVTIAPPNDSFRLSLNLAAGSTLVTVGTGTYATPTALMSAIQAAIDNPAALGPNQATVSLDASNRLVVTSALMGSTSRVGLSSTAGSTGFAAMFGGGATSTQGTISTAGTVLYDLVDADTGLSVFTQTTSDPAAGTYSHRYTSGSPISLSSPLGPAFDFGASITITGSPLTGDAFTLKDSTDPVLGNGYFVTAPKTAAAVNMGSGIIGAGEVLDQAKWDSPMNSRQLEVRFWKDPSDTSANAPVYYDLVDARSELSLLSNTPSTSGGTGNTFTRVFKSGDPIAFSGLAAPYDDFGVTATISGTPANGDVFTLSNSRSQSVFETLGNLIHALESPVGPIGSYSNAELHNKLSAALTSLTATGDNVSRVQAEIGTHMNEVDDLTSVSQNLDLQYATTLSGLQDVDYAKAITDLTRMQMELQAAQQSFAKVSNLSLFNYL